MLSNLHDNPCAPSGTLAPPDATISTTSRWGRSRGDIELADWRNGTRAREARAAFELPAIRDAIARGLAGDRARFEAAARNWRYEPVEGVPELPCELGEDGRIRRIAEFDDSVAVEEAKFRESARFVRKAEATLMELMEEETGLVVSPEKYEKRMNEKDNLRGQAGEICRALERVGVKMFRTDNVLAWRYHVHSALFEELPNYRRVMLNPYMAAMARASKLAALEHFLSLYAPWQYRFWTFTGGKRCRSHEIRSCCQWMFRRLSTLNHRLKKMGFPVEFVFRSTEFGKTEKTGKSRGNLNETGGEIERYGRHTFYHPHMHTVLFVRKFMDEGMWKLMLSIVHDFWRRDGERLHWDAGEMIHNARECVKYVTKPGDMVALARGNPRELKRLFEATEGLRMVAPMGGLKKRIRARKDAGLMLVRKTKEDGCIWLEVRNPDHRVIPDEHTDREKNLLADARAVARLARRAERPVCEVVKRCMPTVGPMRVKEPTVLVIGNTLDAERVRRHPLVARIRHYTQDAYNAGLALANTDFEARARERLGQCSHGHINCFDATGGVGQPPVWPPPRLEIDHDYIAEADENPIYAR
jgi:hypothetical protein